MHSEILQRNFEKLISEFEEIKSDHLLFLSSIVKFIKSMVTGQSLFKNRIQKKSPITSPIPAKAPRQWWNTKK